MPIPLFPIPGAPAATALTTTANLDIYLGAVKAAAFQPAQKTAAINAASAAIASWCDRTFEAAAYREWLDGTGEPYIRTSQTPVNALYRALVGSQVVLRLTNSTVGLTGCYCSVDDGTMTLTVQAGASSELDTLTLSTYDTMALLAAAIAALAHGWTATVVVEGTPSDIMPQMLSGKYSTDILEIESVDDQGGAVAVVQDKASGLIYNAGGWTSGVRNVFLHYNAGYATIPADLEMVAIRLATDILESPSKDGNVESEKLGDYAYKLAGGKAVQLAAKYADELVSYKRLSL